MENIKYIHTPFLKGEQVIIFDNHTKYVDSAIASATTVESVNIESQNFFSNKFNIIYPDLISNDKDFWNQPTTVKFDNGDYIQLFLEKSILPAIDPLASRYYLVNSRGDNMRLLQGVLRPNCSGSYADLQICALHMTLFSHGDYEVTTSTNDRDLSFSIKTLKKSKLN